jgi:pumilio family protein 6
MRDRRVVSDERQKIVQRMVEQMKNRVLQVTLRHDASRMVQSILQFGDTQQKEVIFSELVKKTYEVAKTPYGHFTILKAITYCTSDADQKRMVSALKGHFVSLGTNVIGARTVESIVQLFPATLSKPLKAEFYGQVLFCLFKCIVVSAKTC